MKRIGLLAILLTVLVLAGCGTLDQTFVNAMDKGAVESGLLDEYEQYVENDPNLSDTTKVIRRNSAKELRTTIEKAKKSLEDD